jgi:hypothetical protein
MRALLVVGILLIVLGVVSLFVGIPRRHSSGVRIGGAEIGVQTKSSERLPLPASIAIILGGVALAALSARASH